MGTFPNQTAQDSARRLDLESAYNRLAESQKILDSYGLHIPAAHIDMALHALVDSGAVTWTPDTG
jgi:hypothetical protein